MKNENYFYDTEFIEGKQRARLFGMPLPWKTKPTIDLISIAIIHEKGSMFSEVSKDFNLREAWNRYDLVEASPAKKYMGFYTERVYWIRNNVLKPIFDANKNVVFPNVDSPAFTFRNMRKVIKFCGRSSEDIRDGVMDFVRPTDYNSKVCLYAWYAAYDHVGLCWLFGKMMDLPNYMPKFSLDLKQMYEQQQSDRTDGLELKDLPNYPFKPATAHSAAHDADWNLRLFKFLKHI